MLHDINTWFAPETKNGLMSQITWFGLYGYNGSVQKHVNIMTACHTMDTWLSCTYCKCWKTQQDPKCEILSLVQQLLLTVAVGWEMAGMLML
jgi:hypothetical protein